jgi:hypothetical protein
MGENIRFEFDEAKFRRNLPWQLERTNVNGVFHVSGPPPSFDWNNAGKAERARYGLLADRPDEKSSAVARSLWERGTARKWERIVPTLEVTKRKRRYVPFRRSIKRVPLWRRLWRSTPQSDGPYDDTRWAGGVLSGSGPWTGIVGTWVLPTVSQPSEPSGQNNLGVPGWFMSSWVGLGGFDLSQSNNVVQAGVTQEVGTYNGQPVDAYAWFEWWVSESTGYDPGYVNETRLFNSDGTPFSVSPGNEIAVWVFYTGNRGAMISYWNDSTNQNVVLNLVAPTYAIPNGASAEWVIEAPDMGEPGTPIPAFTPPLTFNNCLACQGGGWGPCAGPSSGQAINLVEGPGGKTLATAQLGSETVTIDFVG